MPALRKSKTRQRCRAMLVALGTSIALLTFAGIAQAETTTLGPALTGPGANGYTCAPAVGGGCGEMLLSTSLPSVQIASPVDGTVVRWRIKGASAAPDYSLDVLRHNSDGSYTVTASTGSVTPAGNEIETLATSLPIHVGEYIELNLPQGGEFTALEAASTYVGFFPHLESGETRQPDTEFEYPFTFAYNADVEYEPPSENEPTPTPTPVPTTLAAAPVVKAGCIAPMLEGMKLRTARETVKAAHCALGKNIRRNGANNRNGKVVGQSKKPGTTLAAESVVRVTLGKG
jgi:PASTA domain